MILPGQPNPRVVEKMSHVKHIILVLSGKGGVGKSTVASGIASSFARKGYKVGLLDIDICGPSIPRLFGLEGASIFQSETGWIPKYVPTSDSATDNPNKDAAPSSSSPSTEDRSFGLMSIGFMLDKPDSAIVWRGPKKTAMIMQFLTDVQWGELDYLVIDTPPGTSDEHMSIVENLRGCSVDGAVLVTTPQQVAVADVRKEVSFCRKTSVPIIGVVENMSGYVCPHCSECTEIFLKGGGEDLARETHVPFLGRIPIEPKIALAMDSGSSFVAALQGTSTGAAFAAIIENVVLNSQ